MTRSLAGTWRFALDARDRGERDRWFRRRLGGTIRLPGSLQAQGNGERPSPKTEWMSNTGAWGVHLPPHYRRLARSKKAFTTTLFLQPHRHYQGPAWYQRDVVIPTSWSGRRVVLELERCHWTTAVWFAGRRLESQDSLSVPHRHVLTDNAIPGRSVLTLRVDNRYAVDIGRDAHSISDHTQTNWNGVIGRVALTATPRVWIEDVQVYPDARRRSVDVRVTVGNATGGPASARLLLACGAVRAGRSLPVEWNGATTTVRLHLPRSTKLWDEFSPALHRLRVVLITDSGRDTRVIPFGLRDFRARGTRFAINGRPVFLRGTLECAVFPRTGYPPADVRSWRRIFAVCMAHGLNHMRFHSWCPPEAAFAAADAAGVYLQIEAASWASVGDGRPQDAWIQAEARRILREYGHHPSFVMMAYGNEPGGTRRDAWLGGFVRALRREDPRRVHTSGSGWPAIPENQFHVHPDPRIQHWAEGLASRVHARPPETMTDYRAFVRKHKVPVVAHEIGQWCAYPNFAEMRKYTGLLQPRNFAAFKAVLAKQGMARRARDFLMASGTWQEEVYKEEVESALRTSGFGGFQLLDLHDFPGQGTSLVGVLDPFWDPKPYHDVARWRGFCGPTVVLARMKKRSWTSRETFRAALEVAHFGSQPLPRASVRWRITNASGRLVASGRTPSRRFPIGNALRAGAVAFPLHSLQAPGRYVLSARLDGAGATNSWSFWVYPNPAPLRVPKNVLVTRTLDAAARARLAAGGRVLYLPDPKKVDTGGAVLGFAPVFWNTCFTNNHPPHTLGLTCDPKHPALAGFPNDGRMDWQWWDIVHGASAMCLDKFPRSIKPIIQPIDTWYENRRLALAFECSVGRGRLLVCSADLLSNPPGRPAASLLRASLLAYMSSPSFPPAARLAVSALTTVVSR